jgi:hypothetical protein
VAWIDEGWAIESTEIEGMRRVYKPYTLSNEKLTNDYWVNVRQSIESNPAAAAFVDDTSNLYVATADTTVRQSYEKPALNAL